MTVSVEGLISCPLIPLHPSLAQRLQELKMAQGLLVHLHIFPHYVTSLAVSATIRLRTRRRHRTRALLRCSNFPTREGRWDVFVLGGCFAGVAGLFQPGPNVLSHSLAGAGGDEGVQIDWFEVIGIFLVFCCWLIALKKNPLQAFPVDPVGAPLELLQEGTSMACPPFAHKYYYLPILPGIEVIAGGCAEKSGAGLRLEGCL